MIRQSTEQRIRAAWRQTPYKHDAPSAECYKVQIESLMDTIASLGQQIERLEEKIGELLADHPEKDIFSSLPTDSEITIAALCTAFGPDRDEPYDWSDYSGYFDTSPITESSGKNKEVKMRRARDGTVHKALLDFADSTRRKEHCWAYTYYERKRSEGLDYYHALGCLASRWVKILHAMWRNRTEYDEDFHRRRRRERGNIAA